MSIPPPVVSADDAELQRVFVAGLHEELQRATATVERFQRLGDDATQCTVYTPRVTTAKQPSSEDILRAAGREDVISEQYRDQLVAEMRSAGNRAYVIAGHYRRVAANLQHALDRELAGKAATPTDTDFVPTLNAEHTVLAWAALGRLGYLRAHDEWTADGDAMDTVHQGAAYRLRNAGLLPEFDAAFADGNEP
ncbi:hypothetical protein [Amycolatopsis sp. cmx-4-68]|uniref:hypothetical protein n=1 Tax=Amycolatopsis sp. cmx-4-68 TaxID=2790938 RepID=UPI00397912ED